MPLLERFLDCQQPTSESSDGRMTEFFILCRRALKPMIHGPRRLFIDLRCERQKLVVRQLADLKHDFSEGAQIHTRRSVCSPCFIGSTNAAGPVLGNKDAKPRTASIAPRRSWNSPPRNPAPDAGKPPARRPPERSEPPDFCALEVKGDSS